jgi:hypothetical protein
MASPNTKMALKKDPSELRAGPIRGLIFGFRNRIVLISLELRPSLLDRRWGEDTSSLVAHTHSPLARGCPPTRARPRPCNSRGDTVCIAGRSGTC